MVIKSIHTEFSISQEVTRVPSNGHHNKIVLCREWIECLVKNARPKKVFYENLTKLPLNVTIRKNVFYR